MAVEAGKMKLSTGWILFLSFSSVLVLPALFSEGMFVDGTIYSSIARNLAIGKGSWWHPQYSSIMADTGTAGVGFFEHPPLQFWLHSSLLSIFGDWLWVDKLFVALVFLCNVMLIRAVCMKLFPDTRVYAHAPWLAAVFWLVTPTVHWSMAHNMLENTMGAFCLMAIWCVLMAVESAKKVMWLGISGVFVLLGFLTKGPVALFPLAAPFLWWVLHRKSTFYFKYIFIPVVVFMILLGVLMWYAPARYFIMDYWYIQVMQSIQAKRELADRSPIRHLHLIVRLLVQSVYMVLCAALLVAVGWKNQMKPLQVPKASWFALFILASATLPMLISIKQRTYYLTPAIPYLAMGLAGVVHTCIPPLREVWIKRMRMTLSIGCVILFGIALSFCGKRTRDEEILGTIDVFKKYVPVKSLVAVCHEMETGSRIGAYMERYGQWETTTLVEHSDFAVTNMVEDTCAISFTTGLENHGWTELGKSGNYIVWKKPVRTD